MMTALLLLAAVPPPPVPVYYGPDAGSMVIVSDSSRLATWRALPDCQPDGGSTLNYTASSRAFSCGHVSGGGGGGSDAGGAPVGAQYWVGAADSTLTGEKNLGALSTGLVINTAGTPSAYAGSTCGAGNYVTAASASGALTCSVPPGTPGGSSPQVQYNNAGAFGGISKVTSDGTHQILSPVYPTPSAPSAGVTHFDYALDGGWPPLPGIIDSNFGISMQLGALSQFPAFDTSTWLQQCARPAYYNTNTINTLFMPAPSTTGSAAAAVAWDAGAWVGRQNWIAYTTLTSANASTGVKNSSTSGSEFIWRGNTAGAGGFIVWMRWGLETAGNANRVAAGLFDDLSFIGSSAEPSSMLNSVYFGCDRGESNLSICSNDGTASATCSTLGGSFPCTTNGAMYDIWLAAPPNASYVNWYIRRWDSAAEASGRLTSDLPVTFAQLNWQLWQNTANSDAGLTLRLRWGGMCQLVNP
jgi:hypothetical protein